MAGRARRTGPVLFAISLAACAGCVSKPALVPVSYAIDPPAAAPGVPHEGGGVLALTRVDVAPPYAGISFVYRTGDHGIERDPYASFAVSPGWMLSTAIRGYLRNAPYVRDVVSPGAGVPFAASIEAHATELYADLGSSPVAVLSLQFRVLSSPSSGGPPGAPSEGLHGARPAGIPLGGGGGEGLERGPGLDHEELRRGPRTRDASRLTQRAPGHSS